MGDDVAKAAEEVALEAVVSTEKARQKLPVKLGVAQGAVEEALAKRSHFTATALADFEAMKVESDDGVESIEQAEQVSTPIRDDVVGAVVHPERIGETTQHAAVRESECTEHMVVASKANEGVNACETVTPSPSLAGA